MTLLVDDPRALASSGTGGTALRWSLAAVTVAATYATAIWLAFALPPPEGAEGELQDAVMIELEPMTAIEEAPPPAPEPEVVEEPIEEPTPAPAEPPVEEVVPEPSPEPAAEEPAPPDPVAPEEIAPPEEVVPPEPVIPEPLVQEPPVPEPVEQLEPLPEPTTQEVVPDPVETDAIAAAVLNPPIPTVRPPPPRPVETVERKPRVEKSKVQKERRKAEPAKKPERPRTVAETRTPVSRSSTARSDRPAATRSASAPRASSVSWQRSLLNHLRKFSSSTRSRGTTRITVVFDRGGRVTQASIAGSSGDATLDRETLALVRRASPFPPPSDADVGRSVVIPIRIR